MQSFSTFTKISRPIPEKKSPLTNDWEKIITLLERMQAKPGVAEKVCFLPDTVWEYEGRHNPRKILKFLLSLSFCLTNLN